MRLCRDSIVNFAPDRIARFKVQHTGNPEILPSVARCKIYQAREYSIPGKHVQLHCIKNLFLLENLPHFHSQIFHRKWFLNELNPLIKHPVMGDHIGCIARHVKDFKARLTHSQL